MNFSMLDMNSMMPGKEIASASSPKKNSKHSNNVVDFLSRFEQALQKNAPASNIKTPQLPVNFHFQGNDLKEQIEELFSNTKTPMEFISALSQLMNLLAKGNLDKLRIDPQGLALFKEMLKQKGFPEEKIDEIFETLAQFEKEGSISADKILQELAKLDTNAADLSTPKNIPSRDGDQKNEDENEMIYSEAMLPVLQSILYNLGIEKHVADNILAKAEKKNQGIQLNQFLVQLKTLAQQNQNKPFQASAEDNSMAALFEQMGIPLENDKIPASLNQFIASLESLRDKITRDQQLVSDMNTLQEKGIRIQDVLSRSLKEIFSDSPEKNSESLQTLVSSIDDKAGELSTLHKNIHALAQDIRAMDTESSEPASASTRGNGKNLFNAFMEHMKVEEKDSHGSTQISSEELKKNILSAEKKQQDKAFGIHAGKGDVKNPETSIAAMSEQTESQSKKEKSSMEEFALVKGFSTETKKQTSHNTHGAMEPQDQRKITAESKVKTPPSPARPLPIHVTRQVSKGVLRAIQQGENTLRLQLKPASLGRLLITIDNLGDSMKVSVMTENQAAKDMLNANVNELKGVLASTGINLAQFDVDMGSDFRQSMPHTGQNFSGSGKKGSNPGNRGLIRDKNTDSGIASISEASKSMDLSGSLHYVA